MSSEIQEFTGKEIEKYKVSKPIGQGKFSTVYKAESEDNGIVALKKIKIFDMMDPKQRDKCLKEVGLMKPLDHPNIIKYIDSFIHNNELIIVTEWAEKGDLKRLIKMQQAEEVPFEEIRVWEYMQQIASALNHMHEKRIMHRDLKPANIFISIDDSLKIGDLGLGREFSSGTIEVYSKVGTPLYMSPELLHGEGYDMKSDVWSLGCIVYELCEFKSPFRNENEKMSLMDLFQNITKGEYKKISKRYSEEMQSIIDKMIVVDPANRIDTAYVLKKCSEIIPQLKKSPKIDCILVNEDIYEKLTLLEYHSAFCKPLNKQPVSKVFFSISDDSPEQNNAKFFYFAELSYWVMSLAKYDKKTRVQAALRIKAMGVWDSVDECAQQLLFDLRKWGLRLPDTLTPAHIRTGHGDTVCFILNDVLNRELIRLNFKFEEPKRNEIQGNSKNDDNQTNDSEAILIDPDLDEFLIQDDNESQESMDLEEEKLTERNKIDEQESGIIQTKVSVLEWDKEVQRVSSELQQFDIRLRRDELTKPLFGITDYQTNLTRLSKQHTTLKTQSKLLKEPAIGRVISKWTQELEEIAKGEHRLNEGNQETLKTLKEKVSNKKSFLHELESRSETVKNLIAKLDALNEESAKVKKQIIDRENAVSSNDKTNKIKTAIQQVKTEIKQMDVKIGVLQNSLLTCHRENADKAKHGRNETDDEDSHQHLDDIDSIKEKQIGKQQFLLEGSPSPQKDSEGHNSQNSMFS